MVHYFICLSNTKEMSFSIGGTFKWIRLIVFSKFRFLSQLNQLHSAREIYDAIIKSFVPTESSVHSRANKVSILSCRPNQVYEKSHAAYCSIITARSWLILKTARKRENFSFVRGQQIVEYISILPQHGTFFCKGDVTPLQLLQEDAITPAATQGQIATKNANYLTSPIIVVNVGASKVSLLNQTLSRPHLVSLKDQTLFCEEE